MRSQGEPGGTRRNQKETQGRPAHMGPYGQHKGSFGFQGGFKSLILMGTFRLLKADVFRSSLGFTEAIIGPQRLQVASWGLSEPTGDPQRSSGPLGLIWVSENP
jgi:hypothetical protein